MFACGLNLYSMLPLLALGAGGLTCLISIGSGVVCLCCSKSKFGLWLICLPVAIVGLALAFFAIFFSRA